MVDDIKSIKDRVHELLVKYPSIRDSDRTLILRIWAEQMAKRLAIPLKDAGDIKFVQFKNYFLGGYLASPESIRRSRQGLQAKYPELRGKNYEGQQQRSEDMRKEVKTLFD